MPAGHRAGTYTGANNCSGAVGSNYTITYVPGNVQITPVALTITASSASFTYGGTVPAIIPAYSGFVNGDTAASLATTPTCSTAATSSSPVSGSPYPSSCAGAVDSNYTIHYVNGSVTENAATTSTAITSIAPSPSMVGQPVTVSYTVTVNAPGSGTIPGTDTVTVTDSTGGSCKGTISAGYCALVPTAVGPDTMTATYSGDSNFSTSKSSVSTSFSIVPTISLTGLPATATPQQSTSVGLALNTATPTQLTGTLTLSFQPNAAGIGTTSNYIDPGTQFAAGGTTLNFTVPAGASVVNLPQNGAIQQGTTAGTIIVTLTSLTAGTTAVALPQPNPSRSVTVPPLAPVITSGTISNLSSTRFNVVLDAYSTSHDLASVAFTFQAASGTTLNNTAPSTISLSNVASSWFSGTGLQYGGSFELTVPFTFSGDTSALGSVTVILSSSVGSSSSVTVAF